MPCKDTTAQISVVLDEKDCLITFDFSKLTCQKAVGGKTGFVDLCRGKHIDKIIQLEFSDLVVDLGLTQLGLSGERSCSVNCVDDSDRAKRLVATFCRANF